jgi:hypothetical protein
MRAIELKLLYFVAILAVITRMLQTAFLMMD